MATFLDTNILIYAFATAADNDPQKVTTARSLVSSLLLKRELIISTQVLSEFSVNAMRKGNPPLSVEQTANIVAKLTKHHVLPIDGTLVQLALDRVRQSRISYWDALIVETAIRSGATILCTEDMHHGIQYGTLEVRNPFR